MKKIKKRSNCPISYGLDFFGDKWTLLILRDMIFAKKLYFKDFLNAKEGIATNILTDRLRMLEAQQFIQSQKDPTLKTRKIYTLTSKGIALIPIILEIMVWSNEYGEFGEDAEKLLQFVKLYKENKEETIMLIRNLIVEN